MYNSYRRSMALLVGGVSIFLFLRNVGNCIRLLVRIKTDVDQFVENIN